jgi:hypothetical protein
MKIKIIAIGIILIMVGSTFLASANIKNNCDGENNVINDSLVEIKVALFTDDPIDEEFYGPYSRTVHFLYALEDYSWKVGDITYCFKTTILRTADIIGGKLTKENFDVFLYPPDSVNEYFTSYGIIIKPENIIRTRKIVNFVKSGGGYFGTCSGSLVAGDFENKPITLMEKLYHNCCLKISNINVTYRTAFPIFGQLSEYGYKYPSSSGYIVYSGWNLTDYDINYHTGVSLDVSILKDNAIFDDYLEETRRIRWISGPDLILPENTSGIQVLANFPTEEISDNDSTDIHYWKYTGGLRGILKALISGGDDIHWAESLSKFYKGIIFAEDWKMVDETVETNFSNKPFMTSEIYRNENQARIVRCTGHPEDNVWWGGHIEELDDTKNNNMYNGFHRWKDIIPEDETVEDEFSYNFWIIRRCVAWAAKIPDNDLPPVYGPSEVKDVSPYNQSSKFTIYGNMEKTSKGIESLRLYYRFSYDNNTWRRWKLYETDTNTFDGWSWDFDSHKADGTGFYQFYSQRCIRYEFEWMNETVPPGPDAVVKVI